jgi:hypothetical protein
MIPYLAREENPKKITSATNLVLPGMFFSAIAQLDKELSRALLI